jgi:hypothetical protein
MISLKSLHWKIIYDNPPTHGILTPPTHGISTPYPLYLDPPTHGISTPHPWYFDSYLWYIDLLLMVYRAPTHDILTPLPLSYGILIPLYGKLTPLISNQEIGRGSTYHG